MDLISRILQQKDSSYKWQFYTKVCASPSLVTISKDMSERNIKVKNLMCQIFIQMLKYHVIPKSSYQNWKICIEKVLQDEWMRVADTAIAKLWNFSKTYPLNYEILLPFWILLQSTLKSIPQALTSR